MTATTSPSDVKQLVNGSEDALMRNLVPALAAWVDAAMPPPRRAAAIAAGGSTTPTAPAAKNAPKGILIKVLTVSKHFSTHGTFSEQN